MSDSILIILAIIAIVPPTIASIAALIQSRKNNALMKANTITTNETSVKTDILVKKTDKIHDLTNSNLAGVKKDLKAALKEIANLNAIMISHLTKEKKLHNSKSRRG